MPVCHTQVCALETIVNPLACCHANTRENFEVASLQLFSLTSPWHICAMITVLQLVSCGCAGMCRCGCGPTSCSAHDSLSWRCEHVRMQAPAYLACSVFIANFTCVKGKGSTTGCEAGGLHDRIYNVVCQSRLLQIIYKQPRPNAPLT